jgi:hypothetical protein
VLFNKSISIIGLDEDHRQLLPFVYPQMEPKTKSLENFLPLQTKVQVIEETQK